MVEPEHHSNNSEKLNTSLRLSNPESKDSISNTSRMTEQGDDGDMVESFRIESTPLKPPPEGRAPGTTGPVGEPGLLPSRPSSVATANSSKRRTWGQSPPTRRGVGPYARGPGSAAGSTGTGSRPGTATSRTHVPSIAHHAFFHPMSSQRLQAQRGQRQAAAKVESAVFSEGQSDTASNTYRQSVGSAPTTRAISPYAHQYDDEALPPPSRGTDVTTDVPERTTANSTPTGAQALRSRGESVTPLQAPTSHPAHLDLSQAQKSSGPNVPSPVKSPRSFRSSFMLPGRGGVSSSMRQQGHEKLSSTASSPVPTQQNSMNSEVRKKLGKNHEYFQGNTVFFWGGRLQNTRDRPISVLTALLIIIPTAIFLAYS